MHHGRISGLVLAAGAVIIQASQSTPRGQGPTYFDVVIDQISGATGATTTVRTWISDQGVRAAGPQAPRPQ